MYAADVASKLGAYTLLLDGPRYSNWHHVAGALQANEHVPLLLSLLFNYPTDLEQSTSPRFVKKIAIRRKQSAITIRWVEDQDGISRLVRPIRRGQPTTASTCTIISQPHISIFFLSALMIIWLGPRRKKWLRLASQLKNEHFP